MKLHSLFGLAILSLLTMSFVSDEDWFWFQNKDYKILFPKKPDEKRQIINSEVGELETVNFYYAVPDNENDDNLVYLAGETLYPENTIHSDSTEIIIPFFRGGIDNIVSSFNGKLLVEEIISLGKYPGRRATIRVTIQDKPVVITLKMFLVKNKAYVIQVITNDNKKYNNSIPKFLNSFELTQ